MPGWEWARNHSYIKKTSSIIDWSTGCRGPRNQNAITPAGTSPVVLSRCLDNSSKFARFNAGWWGDGGKWLNIYFCIVNIFEIWWTIVLLANHQWPG